MASQTLKTTLRLLFSRQHLPFSTSSISTLQKHKTSRMGDPYTDKSAADASPSTKIKEIRNVIKAAKFSMLTTQGTGGLLHSRAMTPASDKGLVFSFVANQDSGKFDDLQSNPQVNVSWSDPSSTDWVSAAGKASVLTDVETIKAFWTPTLKSWFGDLKDGKHTGDWNDPRVAVIQVVPAEIRYWHRTESTLTQTFEVVKGAITGDTASPGVLRVITASELELARKVEDKEIGEAYTAEVGTAAADAKKVGGTGLGGAF
ncbi:hypothetical protein T439DRAFT_315583 [Meredithblackwellia eburnea MCA 4105]